MKRPTDLPALTSLRFFAALAVIAHHTAGFWPGYGGVSFFFVLSGYILTISYRHRIGTRAERNLFWAGRVRRIWCTHLVVLMLALPLGVPSISTLLANAFLVQAWNPDPAVYFSLNAVAWSLSAEAFFYLCFPTIAGLRMRAAVVAVGALIVACIAASLYRLDPKTAHWAFYINPLARIPEFIVGIALASIPVRRVSMTMVALAWAATCAIVWLTPTTPFTEALVFIPASALTVIGLADQKCGWIVHPWLIAAGEASFLLYMLAHLIQRYFHAAFGVNLISNLSSAVVALAVTMAWHWRRDLMALPGLPTLPGIRARLRG